MFACSGTSAWPSIFAAPASRKIVRASSFCPVECQPTLSSCFKRTEPARRPLVCRAPFNNGQSPPAQSREKVMGSRFCAASCARMWSPHNNPAPKRRRQNLVHEHASPYLAPPILSAIPFPKENFRARLEVPISPALRSKMNIDQLRKICLSFPGVTEQIQWGDDLLFKVGGKMFAITPLEPARV